MFVDVDAFYWAYTSYWFAETISISDSDDALNGLRVEITRAYQISHIYFQRISRWVRASSGWNVSREFQYAGQWKPCELWAFPFYCLVLLSTIMLNESDVQQASMTILNENI